MTAGQALRYGRQELAAAGIDSRNADARLLLAHALLVSPSYLFAHPEYTLSAAQIDVYTKYIHQRKTGLSTARVIGYKEFRFLTLRVNADVLIPRADTETLVEAALEYGDARAKDAAIRVLDVCTGSGAVALSLAHERPRWEVWASDISQAALDCARVNARENQLNVHFVHSDVFSGITGRFDCITANAPYIPTGQFAALPPEVRAEPALALLGGADGLDIIRTVISNAPKHLLPGGALFLEAAPGQMPCISGYLKDARFSCIQIFKDLAGSDRVAGALLQ